jgi:DNA-binding CsgD family transcriptional regulator
LTRGGRAELVAFINEFVQVADEEFPGCPVTGFLRDSFSADPGRVDPAEFRGYAARARQCARAGACACDEAGDSEADDSEAGDSEAGDRSDSGTHDTGSPGADGPRSGGNVSLTARETAVLALMAEGLIAVAIARQLGISPRTVGKHVENIYRKFGTQDRASAVLRAHSLGLLRSR